MNERDALAQQNEAACQKMAPHTGTFIIPWQRNLQFVIKRQIVVSLHILHHLGWSLVVASASGVVRSALQICGDPAFHERFAGDKAGIVPAVEVGTFDCFTQRIIEMSHTGHAVRILLDSLFGRRQIGVQIPPFTEHDDGRIDCIQSDTDFIHRFDIMDSHQIKAESVHVEVLRPISDAVDDVFAHHITLRSGIVTDTRPIG